METQITLCAAAGLWQYISLPRGWPRANEPGGPAAGTLRTGYREETEKQWRHHLKGVSSDVLFEISCVRSDLVRPRSTFP